MGTPGTFNPDSVESPTSGTYTSGAVLSSIVVLFRLDMKLGTS